MHGDAAESLDEAPGSILDWIALHLSELDPHRGHVVVLHPQRGILASAHSFDDAYDAARSLGPDPEVVLYAVPPATPW